MPATMERNAGRTLVRLEGDCTLESATELKLLLVAALAGSEEVQLDLEGAGQIDITAMQLIWAAISEGTRTGISVTVTLADPVRKAAQDAGFGSFLPLISVKQ